MHYQWRNTFLITRSSAIADAVTRRIAATVSCPIGVRISTGPNRRRLSRLATARNTLRRPLPRSCESFTNTSQAGPQESNRDRACAELKYQRVLAFLQNFWPQLHVTGLKPTARKSRPLQSGDDCRATPHDVPNQAGPVVLDHQHDRPLIDSEVIRRDPPTGGAILHGK